MVLKKNYKKSFIAVAIPSKHIYGNIAPVIAMLDVFLGIYHCSDSTGLGSESLFAILYIFFTLVITHFCLKESWRIPSDPSLIDCIYYVQMTMSLKQGRDFCLKRCTYHTQLPVTPRSHFQSLVMVYYGLFSTSVSEPHCK